MDVGEVRAAFVSSENIFTRIRKFQTNRVDETNELEIPVPFGEAPRIILHAIPLNAFRSETLISLEGLEYEHVLRPLIDSVGFTRFNFDGFLHVAKMGEYPVSYVQIFRNGCIEWGDIDLLADSEGKRIYSYGAIEYKIIGAFRSSFEFFKKFCINPPVVYFLTFLNVMGYKLPSRSPINDQSPLDRDDLFLPDLFVESYDQKPEMIVRPWFDAIWNAFGRPKDPCFNENGAWERSRFDE